MMETKEQTILELAQTLFDVAAGTGQFLILGLETRPDRDLDEIIIVKGHYEFPGFSQSFKPRMNKLLQTIRELGETARQLRYSNEIQIKELAVRSGIGKWGRSSLVIHEQFGTRLRFVAIEISLDFGLEKQPRNSISPACHNCERCINVCPSQVINNHFSIIQPENCFAYLDLHSFVTVKRCDICQTICPAND